MEKRYTTYTKEAKVFCIKRKLKSFINMSRERNITQNKEVYCMMIKEFILQGEVNIHLVTKLQNIWGKI